MSIRSSIFKEHHPIRNRMLNFGRFNDNYKPDDNYVHWERALKLHDEENYLDSLESVFKFLSNPGEQNLSYTRSKNQLYFTFYQGSKLISGLATGSYVKASAKIAGVTALDVGFMRLLLEANFDLNFTRFCLDSEGDLAINFDSFTMDASPYKMFYGLKELATKADKLDDLLVDQYQVLEPINTGHIKSLSIEIKAIKYAYFIRETKKLIGILSASQSSLSHNHGGVSYLILSHLYTMDYFLRPEGFLMETIERLHRMYFAEDGRSFEQKNAKLLQSVSTLLARPKEKYMQEFYNSVFTFGRMQEGSFKNLKDIIRNEWLHMDWYYENGEYELALAIPKYIASYCLFYFEIGDPGRAFLNLYMEILAFDFVINYAETPIYIENNKLQQKVINRELKAIFKPLHFSNKRIREILDQLLFDDLPTFSKSYFSILKDLDF